LVAVASSRSRSGPASELLGLTWSDGASSLALKVCVRARARVGWNQRQGFAHDGGHERAARRGADRECGAACFPSLRVCLDHLAASSASPLISVHASVLPDACVRVCAGRWRALRRGAELRHRRGWARSHQRACARNADVVRCAKQGWRAQLRGAPELLLDDLAKADCG
jgi:hypothetical protein